MFEKETGKYQGIDVEHFKSVIAKVYLPLINTENNDIHFNIECLYNYASKIIEKYNNIKILGMREPVPLRTLYVRANILEKISARIGADLDELEKFFDRDHRAFGKSLETKDGEEIVNQLSKFIVLGKPGAGKTTYLKFLALRMFDSNSKVERRKFPIFITLREFADKKINIFDFILDDFIACGFENPKYLIEQLLHTGECILLFDGLDEVGQEIDLDGIINEITAFSEKYHENQFVISCRIAAYNHWFEHFTDVEIADFNYKQIETFIRNWFQRELKVAQECWERINGIHQFKELASIPLLLTLLCIVYQENNNFPSNRAQLYEDAIDALLRKWDASRRIKRDEIYKHLSIKHKENMFSKIAYGTFLNNQYFIKQRLLTDAIGKYIENIPGFIEEKIEPDSKIILESIEAHHGIFVQRAKGIYSFAHLTFQEYFTAKYIVDNSRHIFDENQESLLSAIINNYLYDQKWREVFLLIAGMLDDANEFLLRILNKNQTLRKNEGLNKVICSTGHVILPFISENSEIIRRIFSVFSEQTAPKDSIEMFVNELYLARNVVDERVLAIELEMTEAYNQYRHFEQLLSINLKELEKLNVKEQSLKKNLLEFKKELILYESMESRLQNVITDLATSRRALSIEKNNALNDLENSVALSKSSTLANEKKLLLLQFDRDLRACNKSIAKAERENKDILYKIIKYQKKIFDTETQLTIVQDKINKLGDSIQSTESDLRIGKYRAQKLEENLLTAREQESANIIDSFQKIKNIVLGTVNIEGLAPLLANYIYGYILIYDCLETDCYVDKSTRVHIQTELLSTNPITT